MPLPLGFGFDCGHYHRGASLEWTKTLRIVIPHWLFVCCFAVLPAIKVWATMKRRGHTRRGECLNCGYDLRAHKLGERCPECGIIVSRKTSPLSIT